MSSLRNAVKRKTHKERSQPAHRRRLGLLEKKQDYVLRAKDYKSKKQRIGVLRQKASFRNPDEFYFKMINSKTKDGVHIIEEAGLSNDEVKLIRSQNLNYLELVKSQDLKKVAKMERNLQFIGEDLGNTHTLFLDDEDEVKKFNKAQFFGTDEDVKDRAFNRIRRDDLSKKNLLNCSVESLEEIKKSREKAYSELHARIERKKKLENVMDHIRTQKQLQSKGMRQKVKDAEDGKPAVFRWKKERKK